MTVQAVEKLAMELPERERAILALHMLDSLPTQLSQADDGLEEASRRDAEMDANQSISLSFEAFHQKVLDRRNA